MQRFVPIFISAILSFTYCTAALADNTNTSIIVMGGYVVQKNIDDGQIVAQVKIYSFSNTSSNNYRNATPIPTPLALFGSTRVNDTIFVVGGESDAQDDQSATKSFFAYSISNDSWTTLPHIPKTVIMNSVFVVNGLLYSIGGMKSSGGDNRFDVFVFNNISAGVNGKWQKMPPQPGVWGPVCAAPISNGSIFLINVPKNDSHAMSSLVYRSDDGAKSWQTVGTFPVLYSKPAITCTTVGDDAIMIVGGGELRPKWTGIYYPKTGHWRQAGQLSGSGSPTSLTVIPENKNVLVCTSPEDYNKKLSKVQKTCQMYDWQKRVWNNTAFTADALPFEFGLFAV